MKHLENYYRNLCEQLQQQLAILEAKMNDKKKDKKTVKKGSKKEKMADKDYDGDGEVESSKDEYFGSKDKAIKKKMAEKKKVIKEGREVHGGIMNYGGFPRVSKLNENGVVDQFNDGDDKPGDEQIATKRDGEGELTAIEQRMSELENRISDSAHNMSMREIDWKRTGIGKKINNELLDLQMKRDRILNPNQPR
jgi:BMFP domain-containing protein YqiC